ncbi:MAG: HAD family phosphatase [Synergistaceae bacterium]|nr:HAD family phosphatase [Synergistaceae bacterium]MBQ6982607.1 HAD family phosphatase [Synergistaceae bacterium]
MITTVIFDVGNVLVDFDWEGFIHRMFPGRDELIAELDVAVWGSGRWDRLDAGDDPEEVFASIIAYSPSHEKELRKVFANVGQTLRKREATPTWLKDLKSRGYRLLYLSNYSHYVMNCNPDVLDFLPLMDGGIFSCDVKLIKPDQRIYEALAEKYSLKPSECVFIDDLERNVKAGRDFGFQAIQFGTLQQTQRDLEALLQEA